MKTNAYQAPSSDEPSSLPGYGAQNLMLLFNVLTFGTYCVAWTLGLISDGLRLNVYEDRIPAWLTQASDASAPWTGFGYYVCALSFAIFSYRASKNATALGLELRHPAGATLYFYIVPFLNLIMPYRVMKDLREASNPTSRARYLGVWWGAYLMARLTATFTQIDMPPETSPDYFRAAVRADFYSGVPAVVSGCLALYLLYDIHRGQSALAEARG